MGYLLPMFRGLLTTLATHLARYVVLLGAVGGPDHGRQPRGERRGQPHGDIPMPTRARVVARGVHGIELHEGYELPGSVVLPGATSPVFQGGSRGEAVPV